MLQSRNVNKENAFAVRPKTPAAKGLKFSAKTPFGDENVRASMMVKGYKVQLERVYYPNWTKENSFRLSSAKRRTPKQASPEVFKDVHQQLSQKLEQAQIAEEEIEIPDIEYMPPRRLEIP
ncbi:hypothetical protein SAICODRAFT_7188 [Saitoella complicata NRRL Y-17804]|nr:uncharacterized protein SAICODRAFT_7188 [Saitoella complicata NRRL Y-17804]ODQ53477.1 hypothetical protein SAICODRAFT_7188 [Saitoella complicata NRRL Y-17804]